MGLNLTGRVVEVEKKPWTLDNGKTGTSFNVYVSGGRARDGALCVKVAPEQFGAFAEGQDVDLPIGVVARVSEFSGQASIGYKLDPEYVHTATARRAAPVSVAS